MIHIAFFPFVLVLITSHFATNLFDGRGTQAAKKFKDFCHLALRYRFKIQGQFLNVRNAVNQ